MKTVLITGGSDGLGKTIAKNLVRDCKVVILATNEDRLKETAKELGCDYAICDISKYAEIESAVSKVIDKYGSVDVLINNAGLWIQGEVDINDADKIQRVIEVNLLGTINTTKACLPIMKHHLDGIIININSQAGINYKAERAIYNASKWGVTGFSKSLEDEIKKYGIRVTDVMPGKMITDMFKKNGIEKGMADGLETQEVARLVRFIIETPKNVTITEVGIKNINN